MVRDRRAIGEKQQKQEKGCETAAGTKPSCSRVLERPRVDDHAGGDFFLKPLALSSALETRDALEEAAELAALLLFGLGGNSQPDSELARELVGSGAVSSCSGMNHCSATSGSKTPPPTDSVSAHASGGAEPAFPAAGSSVKLSTTGLRR